MSYLELLRTYPRYVGFGFLHTFFSSFGQTFLIALFMPSLREAFDISATRMGSYYGFVTIASACLFFFSGPLIDRINLRSFSAGVGIVLACGCMVLAWSPHIVWVIIGLFLIRHGGQALMSHTASTAMSRYFTLARGKSLGLSGLGIAMGEAVLPLLITLSLGLVDWRWTCVAIALACLSLFLPFSLLLVTRKDDIQNPDASQKVECTDTMDELNWSRGEVIRHPYFWMLLPFIIMPPFLGTGIFFFQADIAAFKTWSRAMFASTFIAYGISSAVSSFVSGPFVDRMSAARLLPYTLFPMALGIVCLVYIPSLFGGHLFMILLGVSFGVISNVRNSMWAEVYGRKHLGAIKSFAGVLMVFSTAIAPPLGGWLLESYSVDLILQGSVALIGLVSCIAWLAVPPRKTASAMHSF